MGITYIGDSNGESVKPKAIYAGDSNNLSALVKVAYVGNSSGKSVEVYRNSALPYEYQKVEYIYNTNGTEYIDSGVKPNSDTRVEITFTRASTQALTLFGSYTSNSKYYRALITNTSSPTSIRCEFGDGTNFTSDIAVNSKHTLLFNGSGGNFYLDGAFQFTSTKTFTALNYPMFIFGTSNQSGGAVPSSTGIYIYHFAIKQGNTTIRDMYPCYLKADTQVVGMYDVANGAFYGNDGTGIFYKGPDVN